MPGSSSRHFGRPADRDAYWRRRFFILCGGLAVLALAAWFFTGRQSPPPGAAAAAQTSMAALQARSALPSAAYGSAWPGPSARPSPARHPVTKASPKPARTGKAKAGSSAGKRPRTGSSAGGACAPGDIVLSLLTSQASYPQGAHPRFQMFAVSTAAGDCRLAYGPGSVRVIVTYLGRVEWDSAACAPAAGKTVLFMRGIPQVLTISWNRAAKTPAGCGGALPPGAWGTFQAVATFAGQSSPARTFKLLP